MSRGYMLLSRSSGLKGFERRHFSHSQAPSMPWWVILLSYNVNAQTFRRPTLPKYLIMTEGDILHVSRRLHRPWLDFKRLHFEQIQASL